MEEEKKIKALTEILTKLKGEMVLLKHKHNPEGEFITENVIIGKIPGYSRFDYWVAFQDALISQNNYMGNIAKITGYDDEVIYEDENMLSKKL